MRLLLAGDVMTGRGIDQVLPHPGASWLLEAWVKDARDYVRLAQEANGPIPAPVAPGYPWGDALAEIARAGCDLRIANLETAVTRSDDAWPGKGIHYRMHPGNVECLTAAGWDALTLANNHVLDWGFAGLEETLATLAAAGIRTAGAGVDHGGAWEPAVLRLPAGGRVLLFAFAIETSGVPRAWAATANRSGIAWLEGLSAASASQVAQSVRRARRPGDVAVVSLHWGGNWGLGVPAAHVAFAHELVDLGAADVVHGHSSHHPLAIEVYRGRLVQYGCGDLFNDYEGIAGHGSLRCDAGCLYFATLAADGALQGLEIVPLRTRRFRLERADAAARQWLRSILNEGAFGTRVEEAAGGRWSLRWG